MADDEFFSAASRAAMAAASCPSRIPFFLTRLASFASVEAVDLDLQWASSSPSNPKLPLPCLSRLDLSVSAMEDASSAFLS